MYWIDEFCELNDSQIAVMEPRAMFDCCAVAIIEDRQAIPQLRVAYDRERVLETVRRNWGMTQDDAIEWYEFNMACAGFWAFVVATPPKGDA